MAHPLRSACPAIVICTRNRERSTVFYRDVLGLELVRDDRFAAVFALDGAGATLRVSTVPDFSPHEHTILGFCVDNVPDAVRALVERAVTFRRYPGFNQDELAVWTAPGGTVQTAWFADPDGNVLSITNAR